MPAMCSEPPLRALVSIHDVMPETRSRVEAMLATLALPPRAVTLLVVPGRDWAPDDIAWLRQLQAQGHPLAGHGWHHRCKPPVTLYHKLHSLLLSRDVAEHLSLDAHGIQQLVWRCYYWFQHHDLTPSPLYVPPAWALGALPVRQLDALPFRYVETLAGVHDSYRGTFTPLPLVGFESDTGFRARLLRWFNGINLARARRSGQPVRIGLHPYDRELKLADDIVPLVRRVEELLDYDRPGPVASRLGRFERP